MLLPQDGRSPALVAAWDGHLEALRLLLMAGANPAAADRVRGARGPFEVPVLRLC